MLKTLIPLILVTAAIVPAAIVIPSDSHESGGRLAPVGSTSG